MPPPNSFKLRAATAPRKERQPQPSLKAPQAERDRWRQLADELARLFPESARDTPTARRRTPTRILFPVEVADMLARLSYLTGLSQCEIAAEALALGLPQLGEQLREVWEERLEWTEQEASRSTRSGSAGSEGA